MDSFSVHQDAKRNLLTPFSCLCCIVWYSFINRGVAHRPVKANGVAELGDEDMARDVQCVTHVRTVVKNIRYL